MANELNERGIKCKYCNGDGYTTEHGGTTVEDDYPVQVQCQDCHGEGFYLTADTVKELIAQAEQKAVGSINHKAMCKDIYDLVAEGDEVFNLTDCHLATSDPKGYTEWTQEEAKRMAEILGRVYSIVHGYESGCCAGKY